MDLPPGNQQDLEDEAVPANAAFGPGKPCVPLRGLDLDDHLDVAVTPRCCEVVRAAAAVARPKLQGQPVERPGAFAMEEMSLEVSWLGAIAWFAEPGGAQPAQQPGQLAQPEEEEEEEEKEEEDDDDDDNEAERERQEKRPRLGRPPPPPPSPLACAPREPARPTAPTAPTAPTGTRKGKRSAGSEPPMCLELGRLANVCYPRGYKNCAVSSSYDPVCYRTLTALLLLTHYTPRRGRPAASREDVQH